MSASKRVFMEWEERVATEEQFELPFAEQLRLCHEWANTAENYQDQQENR